MTNLPRPRSGPLTTGAARAPQRAMLRAVGLSEGDLQLPQVAVASSWNEVTPCNLHLNALAGAAKEGVRQAGAVPIEFGTIAVSDGIAMGHEGMKASLVSREVIADSVELMVHAERFDALVAIAGCDKSLPGMLMACARLNVPAAFLYGGTILPGHALGRLSRAIAIIMPGSDLSQPAIATSASSRSACITSSTESAIRSRLINEAFIPSCPIAIPSEIAIVPNSTGTEPPWRTPSFARAASFPRW